MSSVPPASAAEASLPIALYCQHAEARTWEASLRAALPQARFSAWPEAAPDARHAIVWQPSQTFMDAHPQLRLIFNMGAGVDALLRLSLPPQAQVVRIEDGGMAVQMAEYVCHALLRHFREFDAYAASQAATEWRPRAALDRRDFPVGVLGLGALARRVATAVAGFDFPTYGWSRSPTTLSGVTCFSGDAGLDELLRRTRVLVCLLPLTPATRDILRRDTLAQLQRGGYLINVARGAHLVEDDLLPLIDEGHLAGATLDVTREEPLPAAHPFWHRKEIVLTPHISAQTVIAEAIRQIADKIAAAARGEPIRGIVDPMRGY